MSDETEHIPHGERDCPACGHPHTPTVDTHIEGRGHMETLAIKECRGCGTLWGEPKEWFGVIEP